MSEIMHHYTIESFAAFKFGNECKLDQSVQRILTFLDTQIVVPTDIHETSDMKRSDKGFERNNRMHGRGRRGGGNGGGSRNASKDDLSAMMDDWDAIRNFKTTEIVKAVGFEKELNIIRGLLNKLSDKNYDSQKVLILEKVTEIVNAEDGDTPVQTPVSGIADVSNKTKVANMIFDIAVANRFFSELYASLYVELVGEHDMFGEILDGLLQRYRETLNSISYVDPDKDYNKFCDYNKENELRRANAAFIMNLTKVDMISRKDVMDVIIDLQELSLRMIDEDDKKNEVDEITENVFILISTGKTFLSDEDAWSTKIAPFLQEFANRKASKHLSLTNRSVFKYMDMIGK